MFHKMDSSGYRVFSIFNMIFLFTILGVCVLPYIHIIAISFSEIGAANANQVGLVPVGATIGAYRFVMLEDTMMLRGLINSIVRVVVGLSISMAVTILVAYPLSFDSSKFPGRLAYAWFFIIIMLFPSALIPLYVLVKNLNLMNSIWSLILPTAVTPFYILILMNFMRGIPGDISEAAFVDGASHFQCLVKIMIPLSVPSLATLVLFVFIDHWNSWFDGLIFMQDTARYPLQTYLLTRIEMMGKVLSLQDARRMAGLSQRSIKMAYIVLTVIPTLCVYPFIQKHIRAGLVMGSIKG